MWRWIRFIVAGLIPLVAFHGVEAAQRTSVALTVAAGPSDRQLAETLIVLVEANVLENGFFKPAWFSNYGKAGYLVNFVAERGDEVWFGGEQWELFNCSGLYRIHLKTGAFHKFGPADGFQTVHAHSIFDGLWLRDRLWLGTSNGLCVVTPCDGSLK